MDKQVQVLETVQDTITQEFKQLKPLESRVVVKSNDINEVSFNLTTLEYRILFLLITQLQEEYKSNAVVEFNVTQVAEILGLTNTKRNYELIYEAVRSLHSRYYYTKIGNRLLHFTWIVNFSYETNSGVYRVKLNESLETYFFNLNERFLKYRFQILLRLSNFPTIRFYELLKQYEKIGTRIFSVDNLKLLLGFNSTDYGRYFDFKNRVLKKVIEEINRETDIYCELEEIRHNRKVESVKLHIRSKEQSPLDTIEKKTYLFSRYLIKELESFGLTSRQIKFLEKTYNDKRVYYNYLFVKQKMLEKEIKVKDKYLLKAIREDYYGKNPHYVNLNNIISARTINTIYHKVDELPELDIVNKVIHMFRIERSFCRSDEEVRQKIESYKMFFDQFLRENYTASFVKGLDEEIGEEYRKWLEMNTLETSD